MQSAWQEQIKERLEICQEKNKKFSHRPSDQEIFVFNANEPCSI